MATTLENLPYRRRHTTRLSLQSAGQWLAHLARQVLVLFLAQDTPALSPRLQATGSTTRRLSPLRGFRQQGSKDGRSANKSESQCCEANANSSGGSRATMTCTRRVTVSSELQRFLIWL
jgi:hypothetical protein